MKKHRKTDKCICGKEKSAESKRCRSCETRKPTCHPDREHEGLGFCRTCYDQQRYVKRKAGNPDFYNNIARKQYSKHTLRCLLSAAKGRARIAKLPFDLGLEDLEIPSICPVLGIPLFTGIGCATDNSPSIDRIVPKLGYVKGNVRVISKRANTIKSFGTAEEHRKIAAYIEESTLWTADGL